MAAFRSPRLAPIPSRWHLLAFPPAAVLTVVAGLHSPGSSRLLFEAVAAVLVVVVCFRWLLAGTLLFILLTFPAQLPGSIGVGATIAKPLGLVLALAWLMTLVREPGRPFLFRDRPILGGFVLAYPAWAVLSLLWSAHTGSALSDLKRLFLAAILMVILFSVVGNRRDFQILLWGYVVSAGLTSIYVLASGVTLEGRATGGLNDPNYLASELVLAMIGGGYLLGSVSRRSLRLLLLAATGFDVAVFLLTQSRGGIIGIGVGAIVAIVVAGRTRATVVGLISLAAALAIGWVAFLAPTTLRHRVTNFSTQSSSGRTDSWQIAWKIAEAHPLTGVAIGGYRDEQLKYVASSIDVQHVTYIIDNQLIVHNTYLQTLAELGVVGLVLLGGTIVICFGSAVKAIRLAVAAGDHALANAFRGLVAGSAGLLTAYFFVSAQYEKQLWFALALLAISPLVVTGRQAAPAMQADAEQRLRSSAPRLRPVPTSSASA